MAAGDEPLRLPSPPISMASCLVASWLNVCEGYRHRMANRIPNESIPPPDEVFRYFHHLGVRIDLESTNPASPATSAGMKKSFPLQKPPHAPPRVIELIKAEVRKYLKRERRKALPEGVDYWDFDCRIGKDEATAEAVHVAALADSIDRVAAEGVAAVHVEIFAKPGHRAGKSGAEPPSAAG